VPAESAQVELSNFKVSLELGRTRLIAKLLDSSEAGYPDYKRVIPKPTGKLIVDTDMILAALRRALIMADPDKDAYRVKMTIENGGVSLAANKFELGDASDQVEAEWTGGADTAIAFNGTYLLKLLEQVRTENVEIGASDGRSAMTISETGDTDWFGVLMPHAG
jgi:DNA polymerase III sliding clamp (beta) subunit (PCNA family)